MIPLFAIYCNTSLSLKFKKKECYKNTKYQNKLLKISSFSSRKYLLIVAYKKVCVEYIFNSYI